MCARKPETGNLSIEADPYKYELEDGTEIHDPSLPSTTTCPYLPGQSVNLLWVPVEIQMPRDRSASMSSMASGDIKTMVPADKFLTPRAAPPIPSKHSRSNTAPMLIVRKHRSTSPKSEKSLWSPRAFFGSRSPSSQSQKGEKRGLWSPLGKFFGDDASGSPPSTAEWLDEKRNISIPTTGNISTQPGRPLSRELALHQATSTSQEAGSHSLPVTDEIEEIEELEEVDDEDEDDGNFAADPSRIPLSGETPPIPTPLSPPSVGRRSTTSRTSSTRSKPLPDLPHSGRGSLEDNDSPLRPMLPSAMLRAPSCLILSSSPTAVVNLAYAQQMNLTSSTAMTSPTASYFDFSDDEDEEDGANSADEVSIDSPASPQYELASVDAAEEDDYDDDDDGDDWRIKKHAAATAAVAALSQAASRRTFGGLDTAGDNPANEGTVLDDLRKELGYLGGMIVSK